MASWANPSKRRSRLTTHIVTERTAQARCRDLLEQEHALGVRRPKGRSLYQVVCRDDVWVGVILWTGSCWHLKARDQWIGWDAVTRSERLPLILHQGRLPVLEQTREPNLASPEVNLLHATVTADALHCQDQTAHLITRDKGGDYVLQIRDNQPTLHQFAQQQLAPAPPLGPKLTADTAAANSVT